MVYSQQMLRVFYMLNYFAKANLNRDLFTQVMLLSMGLPWPKFIS